MPSVKIKDTSPGQGRRDKLWQCLGKAEIDIWKMKDGRGAYFIILDKQNYQKLIDPTLAMDFRAQKI